MTEAFARPRLIIFDLDGTLIDSAGDLRDALNEALARFGRAPHSLDSVRKMIGEGAAKLVDLALAARPGPPVSAGEVLKTFLHIYETGPVNHTVFYPGVEATLQALADDGYVLAISTNKPEQPAREILGLFGVADKFIGIVGGDSHDFRKPDPRMLTGILDAHGFSRDEAILVGDSETDAATAKAAGIRFVLVTFGYRKGPAEAIEAIARIDRMRDLPRLFATQP
jgi:phosphoglycolate phosphatase